MSGNRSEDYETEAPAKQNQKEPMIINKTVQIWCIIMAGLMIPIPASPAHKDDPSPNNPAFLFLPGFLGNITMICPAHAHGTPEEAMQKLQEMLKDRPADQISSVWVCRANQMATLKMFAPVVDRVYINPFVLTSNYIPEPNDLIWPGFDHSFINTIRVIRSGAGSANLVACLDLRGEPTHFRKRRACFAEIQWMIYAVIGANFQGITWRAKANPAWADHLQRLEDNLKKYSEDLGAAHPVNWIAKNSQNPATAICAKEKLFICLLRSDYLRKTENGKDVPLPLNDTTQKGTVIIRAPKGVSVLSGQTLSGRSVSLEHQQGFVQVEYRFTGGGDMLVLPIARSAKMDPNRKNKGADGND